MTSSYLISLVVPMYNESESCHLFFERLFPVLSAITERFEIVCVDDGSTDTTFETLCSLRSRESRIKIIRLARNFGKDIALTAGIDHAMGDAVIPMDVDLQDPPELIPEMVRIWREEGYDSVVAVRKERAADGFIKSVTAAAFYRLASRLSDVPIQPNAGDFRLLDRTVVDALKALPERNRFMKGLYSWVGFRSTSISYSRPGRSAGQTKWNYWRLWNFALDGLFSFSTIPLRIWTYLGTTLASLAALYGLIIVFRTLMHGVDVPGYASLLVAVLFLGGVNLVGLGILGEYVGRIFVESKQRPLYLVRSIVGDFASPSPVSDMVEPDQAER